MICGKYSHLRGDNLGFALIDEVFTRFFFAHVTWTGNTGKGQEAKEQFNKFVRVRAFFLRLLNVVDKNYDKDEMDKFLHKKIVQQSKRRINQWLEAQKTGSQPRRSTTKCRPVCVQQSTPPQVDANPTTTSSPSTLRPPSVSEQSADDVKPSTLPSQMLSSQPDCSQINENNTGVGSDANTVDNDAQNVNNDENPADNVAKNEDNNDHGLKNSTDDLSEGSNKEDGIDASDEDDGKESDGDPDGTNEKLRLPDMTHMYSSVLK